MLGGLISHSSVTVALVTTYVTWSGDTRRSSSTGDGSLPSGISGVAERDGGVPIYAAVDDVTQLKRFAV